MIELLVVVTIIAILASLLLPALSMAREKSRRAVCGSNLKQLGVGAELYADDNGDFYPTHGYNGKFPHLMADRRQLVADYFVGNHEVFFCPSSQGLWVPPCQPWDAMIQGNGGHGAAYMGYGYFGGIGSYNETYLRVNYYAYRWGGIFTLNGEKLTPTPTRKVPMKVHSPAERPLFSDNAFYYGTTILFGLAGGRSAPAHNHIGEDPSYSVFENITFVDGHVGSVVAPYLVAIRGPYGFRF